MVCPISGLGTVWRKSISLKCFRIGTKWVVRYQQIGETSGKKEQKLEFWKVLPIIWRKCKSPVLTLLCLNWDIRVWVPEFINPKKKDSLTGAARRFVCVKLEVEGNGEGWFNGLLGEHNEMGLPAGRAPHGGASSPENSSAALKTNTSLQARQIPYLLLLPSLFDFGYFLAGICLFA